MPFELPEAPLELTPEEGDELFRTYEELTINKPASLPVPRAVKRQYATAADMATGGTAGMYAQVHRELTESGASETADQLKRVWGNLIDTEAKKAFMKQYGELKTDQQKRMFIAKSKARLDSFGANELTNAAISRSLDANWLTEDDVHALEVQASAVSNAIAKAVSRDKAVDQALEGVYRLAATFQTQNWGRQVALEAVPFLDSALAISLIEYAKGSDAWDFKVGSGKPSGMGSIYEDLREWVFLAPSDEELVRRSNVIIEFLVRHDELSDFKRWGVLMEIFGDEEALRKGDPHNALSLWMGNFVTGSDLVFGGTSLVKLIKKGLKIEDLARYANVNLDGLGRSTSHYTAATEELVNAPAIFNEWVAREMRRMTPEERASAVWDNHSPKPPPGSGGTFKNPPESASGLPDEPIRQSWRVGVGGQAIIPPEGIDRALGALDDQSRTVLDIANRANKFVYMDAEKAAVNMNLMRQFQADIGTGVIRPSSSTMTLNPEGSGIRYELTLGMSEDVGWPQIEGALGAAGRVDPTLAHVLLMRTDESGRVVEEIKGLELTRLYNSKGVSGRPGPWYVKVEDERFYHPTDALIFGDKPVIHPGMGPRWYLNPRAQFSEQVYYDYMTQYLGERALIPKIQSVLRKDWFEASTGTRRTVQDIMLFAEEEGRLNGREIDRWDILTRFDSKATPEVMRAYDSMVRLRDIMYAISNRKLYKDMKARGHRTIKNDSMPGVLYDGIPLKREKVRAGGARKGYDPTDKVGVSLSNKFLRELYARGGWVIKTDTKVATPSGRSHFDLIIVDPAKGWTINPLRTNVLTKHPGYFPRIYKDPFVVKRKRKTRMNGAEAGIDEAIFTAKTRKEAETAVANQQARAAAAGRSDKESWYIEDDVPFSEKDRTASDIERMRTEGRLIFGDRQHNLLNDVYGNPSAMEDPAVAMQRGIFAIARAVSHDELVRVMKERFLKTYSPLLKGGLTRKSTAAEVAEQLRLEAKTNRDPVLRKMAKEAAPMWDYIRLMEGAVAGDSAAFRRLALQLSDYLDKALPSSKPARKVSAGVRKVASEVRPIEGIKSLAFLDFIVSRPGRQLFLQGLQHLFIAPLDTKYFLSGQWWRDSYLVNQGIRKLGKYGDADIRNVEKAMLERNASLMGITPEEYTTLIQEMERSGLLQGIDAHIFGGGAPSERVFEVPKNAVEGGIQSLRKGGLAVYDWFKHVGFDTGEGFNVIASYMMSLRKYLETSGKKIAQLTDKDWKNVANKGSDYAMAMHRSNSSKYQYGLVSLLAQFMSFTHKTFLTMLYKNPAFTKAETTKILIGQYLMFGGSMLGLREVMEKQLGELGLEDVIGTELFDLITGGIMEAVLDRSLEWAFDSDSDIGIGDFLAPGGNIIFTIKKIVENILTRPIGETMLGASQHTVGRLGEAIRLAGKIWYVEDDPIKRLTMISQAIMDGHLSGYSDLMKGYLAMKYGEWYMKGESTGVKATAPEAIMRALLGIYPEDFNEANYLTRALKDAEKDVINDARQAYNDIQRILTTWEPSSDYVDNAVKRIQYIHHAVMAYPEEYRVMFYNELNAIDAREMDLGRPGLADVIAKLVTQGMPVDEYMRRTVRDTDVIDEADKEVLLDWIDEALKEQDGFRREMELNLEEQKTIIEDTFRREDLHKAFRDAKAKGDIAEMERLAIEMGLTEEEVYKATGKAPRN